MDGAASFPLDRAQVQKADAVTQPAVSERAQPRALERRFGRRSAIQTGRRVVM
ncbi:hypothetical protein [uncultured Sphingomonas sp.]|uniref:hypothetical protein n=1 Tax=uncultured Sphingomonas sp. TaxID=158754 RepID=UPI0025D7342F|nr:hypothetical protein [uncultured Sphingomonas sp.]